MTPVLPYLVAYIVVRSKTSLQKCFWTELILKYYTLEQYLVKPQSLVLFGSYSIVVWTLIFSKQSFVVFEEHSCGFGIMLGREF